MLSRSSLLAVARDAAMELTRQPFEHWVSVEFPFAYETSVGGEDVFIEVSLLSKGEQWLQLGVCVSHHPTTYRRVMGITANRPVCHSIVIRQSVG